MYNITKWLIKFKWHEENAIMHSFESSTNLKQRRNKRKSAFYISAIVAIALISDRPWTSRLRVKAVMISREELPENLNKLSQARWYVQRDQTISLLLYRRHSSNTSKILSVFVVKLAGNLNKYNLHRHVQCTLLYKTFHALIPIYNY